MQRNPTFVYEDGRFFTFTPVYKDLLKDIINKIIKIAHHRQISIDGLSKNIHWPVDTVTKFLKGEYFFPDTRLINDIVSELGFDIDTLMKSSVEQLVKREVTSSRFSHGSYLTICNNYIINTKFLLNKMNVDNIPFAEFVARSMEKITGRPSLPRPNHALNLFEVQTVANFFGHNIQTYISTKADQLPPSDLNLQHETREQLQIARKHQKLVKEINLKLKDILSNYLMASGKGLHAFANEAKISPETIKQIFRKDLLKPLPFHILQNIALAMEKKLEDLVPKIAETWVVSRDTLLFPPKPTPPVVPAPKSKLRTIVTTIASVAALEAEASPSIDPIISENTDKIERSAPQTENILRQPAASQPSSLLETISEPRAQATSGTPTQPKPTSQKSTGGGGGNTNRNLLNSVLSDEIKHIPAEGNQPVWMENVIHVVRGAAAFGAGEVVAEVVREAGEHYTPDSKLATDIVATVAGSVAAGAGATMIGISAPEVTAMEGAFLASRFIDNHVSDEKDAPALRVAARGVQLATDVLATVPQVVLGPVVGLVTPPPPLPATNIAALDSFLDGMNQLSRPARGLIDGATRATDSILEHGSKLLEAAVDLVNNTAVDEIENTADFNTPMPVEFGMQPITLQFETEFKQNHNNFAAIPESDDLYAENNEHKYEDVPFESPFQRQEEDDDLLVEQEIPEFKITRLVEEVRPEMESGSHLVEIDFSSRFDSGGTVEKLRAATTLFASIDRSKEEHSRETHSNVLPSALLTHSHFARTAPAHRTSSHHASNGNLSQQQTLDTSNKNYGTNRTQLPRVVINSGLAEHRVNTGNGYVSCLRPFGPAWSEKEKQLCWDKNGAPISLKR